VISIPAIVSRAANALGIYDITRLGVSITVDWRFIAVADVRARLIVAHGRTDIELHANLSGGGAGVSGEYRDCSSRSFND
jgi:hypothetical protein